MDISGERGYTLVEIIIAMALTAVVATAMAFAFLNFRNNVLYDILLNRIGESVNYAKLKGITSKLDSQDLRSSYSVKFFADRIVEFEGDTYVEGDDANIEYEVPVGLRITSTCSPVDNSVVTFFAITGENSNYCTISIYKFEQAYPTGSVYIGKYGVEQAS